MCGGLRPPKLGNPVPWVVLVAAGDSGVLAVVREGTRGPKHATHGPECVRCAQLDTCMRHPSTSSTLRARPEDRGAEPDASCSFSNGERIVPAHAHRQGKCVVQTG